MIGNWDVIANEKGNITIEEKVFKGNEGITGTLD